MSKQSKAPIDEIFAHGDDSICYESLLDEVRTRGCASLCVASRARCRARSGARALLACVRSAWSDIEPTRAGARLG